MEGWVGLGGGVLSCQFDNGSFCPVNRPLCGFFHCSLGEQLESLMGATERLDYTIFV